VQSDADEHGSDRIHHVKSIDHRQPSGKQPAEAAQSFLPRLGPVTGQASVVKTISGDVPVKVTPRILP
jgi:hypothetical protein